MEHCPSRHIHSRRETGSGTRTEREGGRLERVKAEEKGCAYIGVTYGCVGLRTCTGSTCICIIRARI